MFGELQEAFDQILSDFASVPDGQFDRVSAPQNTESNLLQAISAW